MEQTARKHLTGVLKNIGCMVTNVEDRANSGTPDTIVVKEQKDGAFVFFIECKEVRSLPVSLKSQLPAGKMRPGQIEFMRKLRKRRGVGLILLRAPGRRYYLFDGAIAPEYNTKGVGELFSLALACWQPSINPEELLEIARHV